MNRNCIIGAAICVLLLSAQARAQYAVSISDGAGNGVSATHPLPVTGSGTVAPQNRSGTITLGAQAQQLMAANTGRKGCWIQNLSQGDLWLNEIGSAAPAQPSFVIHPGDWFSCETFGVPSSAISIYGAATGQAFAAREW